MKTKIKISKELKRFLTDKGLLNQFEYNCINHSYPSMNGKLRDLWNAFTWQETPEGGIFWNDITTEFESI